MCLVRRDGETGWILRSRGGALVSPEPNISSPKRLAQEVTDVFCYGYVPKPGDVVIDVGAGVGREGFVFSRLVGPTGSVHCIEAHPVTYGFLTRMRALNRLDNLQCHNLAISDSSGFVTISTEDDLGRYYQNRILPGGPARTEVPAMTIDRFCKLQSLTQVDLLAMNIEGAERLAVKGMSQVADRIRNVAIACHDFLADKGGDAELRTKQHVRRFLTKHGFEIEERLDDPRDWLRGFVYGSRQFS
jgi:FkbM family methyltransferase